MKRKHEKAFVESHASDFDPDQIEKLIESALFKTHEDPSNSKQDAIAPWTKTSRVAQESSSKKLQHQSKSEKVLKSDSSGKKVDCRIEKQRKKDLNGLKDVGDHDENKTLIQVSQKYTAVDESRDSEKYSSDISPQNKARSLRKKSVVKVQAQGDQFIPEKFKIKKGNGVHTDSMTIPSGKKKNANRSSKVDLQTALGKIKDAAEFVDTVREEVLNFGVAGLDKRKRKDFVIQKEVRLGCTAPKGIKTPLHILKGRRFAQKKRELADFQEKKNMGLIPMKRRKKHR